MVWPLRFASLTLALLAANVAQAGNMLCCQDATTGRRVCGDSLPEQCRGRAYKILDGAGNVIKEVGPPMTAEQKALAAVEAQRKKEEEAARQEQRRKDQALLATYSSLQDIEQARTRAVNDVLEAVKQAEAKVDGLRKQRKKYEAEMEFYKNKTPPPDLAKNLRDIDYDIKAQTGLIDSKKAELEQVRTKYDTDKRRYTELAGGR
ncbi:MAG TPA: hypothetical protein VFF03_07340 [Rhodocyclaceae bacterium]|nr:hypothetical protein [Rhodocyclaceae bacterium]